ncbi:MAG: 2-C-methyl-D-erythritol 4-phosphate cytidylyltransferase [Candidatus Aminicenantia bacterium]
MRIEVKAVILSAGKGKRFEDPIPKQFHLLKEKPIFEWSVETFSSHEMIKKIILVVDNPPIWEGLKEKYPKIEKIVKGGESRQDSSMNGLLAIEEDCIVLIHDAVRPFVSRELIERVINGVLKFGSAVPVIPETDSLKTVKDGKVLNSLKRDKVFRVQTPQGFYLKDILHSHKIGIEKGIFVNDDSELMEKAGFEVRVVEGDLINIKITTKIDLLIAEAILEIKNRNRI